MESSVLVPAIEIRPNDDWDERNNPRVRFAIALDNPLVLVLVLVVAQVLEHRNESWTISEATFL